MEPYETASRFQKNKENIILSNANSEPLSSLAGADIPRCTIYPNPMRKDDMAAPMILHIIHDKMNA